jgi:hypothetical protein
LFIKCASYVTPKTKDYGFGEILSGLKVDNIWLRNSTNAVLPTAALRSNGHIENTTKEDNEFEPDEPHEGAPVVDDEQLRALPENEEEEKEEILLASSTTAAKTTKPKVSSSKGKSSSGKRRRDETSSAGTTKQLERQAKQLDKITIMLHSIQKDMKSIKGQSKLINQLQSQIKQLQTQMSQIQKNIAKRNFTTATISSRKKIRPKKR